jgi:cell division protein FtsI (penicillin-binding protein 3)
MMRPETPAYRSPPSLAQIWRAMIEGMWKIEHAFERSRNANRAVDDTRVRIFTVFCTFAVVFLFLAGKASTVALFSHAGGIISDIPAATVQRADLVDRNGLMLALDVPHYGVYLDSREIWDVKEARRGLMAALPHLSRTRLDRALISGHREVLVNGITSDEKDRVHDLGLPGVSFEEEPRRSYPLGQEAAHLIGFADPSGKGLAGAERGLDGVVREAAAGAGAIPLSIDLRVQAALESELRKAMVDYSSQAAVGVITNIQTGEVLGLASLPDFDPNEAGSADPATLVNHAGSSLYEMGSTFKVFTFAMGLDSHVATVNSTFDASQPLHLGTRVIHDMHSTGKVLSLEEIFLHSSNIGTARLALASGRDRMQK